jgi:hypothetical protein
MPALLERRTLLLDPALRYAVIIQGVLYASDPKAVPTSMMRCSPGTLVENPPYGGNPLIAKGAIRRADLRWIFAPFQSRF